MYKKPNYFRRLFSFAGTIERGTFWSEVCVRIIEFFCAVVILCIIVSVFLPGDVAYLSRVSEIGAMVLGVFWAIPILALTRRRLRDAGYSAKTYLWLLVPVVGWILFIARLCGKSK